MPWRHASPNAARGSSIYLRPRTFVRVVIQRSPHPTPSPPRSDAKISVVPSNDKVGWKSYSIEFTTDPRFTGGDQGSSVLARVEVHRST